MKAPADGYVLQLAGPSTAINATLYDNLKFNFIRDVTPVANFVRIPLIMEVNPTFPAKTVPEFIAYAKANKGKISTASAGTGTSNHLSGELLKMMTKIEMVQAISWRGARAHRSNRRTSASLVRHPLLA